VSAGGWPGAGGSSGPYGPLAAEAARLVQALQGWAATGRPEATGSQPEGLGDGPAHVPGGDCRICPLCQLAAMLRETRPEVYAHLAVAGESLLAAVRELVLASERRWSGGQGAPVEHIDIDVGEEEGPWASRSG